MHARLSRFAGLDPERIDEALRQFEEAGLSDLAQLPGFRGITVCVNRKSGQAAAITLWETEGDMKRSEELAIKARERAVATAGPSREPIVDVYEVVVHKYGAQRSRPAYPALAAVVEPPPTGHGRGLGRLARVLHAARRMLLLLRGSAERRGARERIGAIEKLHSCIDGRTTPARYRKDHHPPSRRSPSSAQHDAASPILRQV